MRTLYLSAAEIAAVFGIPVSTVRRWASEDRWARTPPARRPVLYAYAQACESFGARQAGRAETLANIGRGRTKRLAS